MKVLASIANAMIRNSFAEALNCEVTFINPHTNSIMDIGQTLNTQGFDFLITDYGPPSNGSWLYAKRTREEIATTPILVFTLYAHVEQMLREIRCASYNWQTNYVWHQDGQELLRTRVKEAQQLVA